MFSEALLQNMSDSDRQLAVLAFCNPVFMDIAKRHAQHYQNQMMSLDVDDADFKEQYRIAKEYRAAWQSLLKFAADYSPKELEWGKQFEALMTQIGG